MMKIDFVVIHGDGGHMIMNDAVKLVKQYAAYYNIIRVDINLSNVVGVAHVSHNGGIVLNAIFYDMTSQMQLDIYKACRFIYDGLYKDMLSLPDPLTYSIVSHSGDSDIIRFTGDLITTCRTVPGIERVRVFYYSHPIANVQIYHVEYAILAYDLHVNNFNSLTNTCAAIQKALTREEFTI